jgi:type I restriction enzyme M protein
LRREGTFDEGKIVHQDQARRQAAGRAFYNTSKFRLRDRKTRSGRSETRGGFYLAN